MYLILRFELTYQRFISLTRKFEQLIGAYINVMFSKTKRTHEGLLILASFEPVCERSHIRSILRDAYVNLFLSKLLSLKKKIFIFFYEDFENDLLDIRTTFEAHKDNPPLPRNAPPVPGRTLSKKLFLI